MNCECMNCIEISIEETTSIFASISINEEIDTDISVSYEASPKTQEGHATPTQEEQILTPDEGYYFSSVTVDPIPQNYGLITYNGYSIMVS